MLYKKEWLILLGYTVLFCLVYFIPEDWLAFNNALGEGLLLLQWYVREHVLLCLVPAFFIAGAIAVFINQASVMKYLGPNSNKLTSYGVASVSGSVLAVCSCTVLPLFTGIYRLGAGIGPATAFLYAGPAINVLAIILTARVLGWQLGVARAVGAVLFSIIIGLLMQLFFKNDDRHKDIKMALPDQEVVRPLYRTVIYFALMIGILVFATWSGSATNSFYNTIFAIKWKLVGLLGAGFAVILSFWYNFPLKKLTTAVLAAVSCYWIFDSALVAFVAGLIELFIITGTEKGEAGDWFVQTVGFAKQIMPLLFIGVFVAGVLLGRPGQEGIIPSGWIVWAVGGDSIMSNLFASVVGALMYFATLTEIPIIEGLLGNGMGKGPALALLLAGPALSLPNMIVIRSVLGTKKTAVFVLLVVAMATVCGILFGKFV